MRSAKERRRDGAERQRDVVRGATRDQLARPAGALLASLPWEGAVRDPGEMAAATFLSRL